MATDNCQQQLVLTACCLTSHPAEVMQKCTGRHVSAAWHHCWVWLGNFNSKVHQNICNQPAVTLLFKLGVRTFHTQMHHGSLCKWVHWLVPLYFLSKNQIFLLMSCSDDAAGSVPWNWLLCVNGINMKKVSLVNLDCRTLLPRNLSQRFWYI